MAAYNLRDTDRNGYGNTWYADPGVQSVDLRRPVLPGRLPQWPGPFLRWFAHRGYSADFYSDEDLDAVAVAGAWPRVTTWSSSPATRST